MENAVLIRGEDYWFSCHATGLIQVVPLAVDRLKAFEHGTIGAEVVPGTSVLIPDIMKHKTGTIEPVLFISILMPVISKYIPRSYHKNASDHPLFPSLLYALK